MSLFHFCYANPHFHPYFFSLNCKVVHSTAHGETPSKCTFHPLSPTWSYQVINHHFIVMVLFPASFFNKHINLLKQISKKQDYNSALTAHPSLPLLFFIIQLILEQHWLHCPGLLTQIISVNIHTVLQTCFLF